LPAVGEAVVPNPWLPLVSSKVLDSRTRLTPDRERTQGADFFGHPAYAACCGVLALGVTAWSGHSALVGPSILNGGAETLPLIAGAIIGWLGTLTCAKLASDRPCPISVDDAAKILNADVRALVPSLSDPVRKALEALCQSTGRTGRLIEATNVIEFFSGITSLEERTIGGTVFIPLLASAGLQVTELYRAAYVAHVRDLIKFVVASADTSRDGRLIKALIDPCLCPDLFLVQDEASKAYVDDLFTNVRDGCRNAPLEKTLIMIAIYPMIPPSALVKENLLAEILNTMREVEPRHRGFVSSLIFNGKIPFDAHMIGEMIKILEEIPA